VAEEYEDESPHMDMDKTDEEAQDTGPAFNNNLDSDVINITIEEDDHCWLLIFWDQQDKSVLKAFTCLECRFCMCGGCSSDNNQNKYDLSNLGGGIISLGVVGVPSHVL
jgi:hypothetical protein